MKRALLVLALLAFARIAFADAKTLDDYVTTLARVRGMLAANQIAEAKDIAKTLNDAEVVWPEGTMHADASLLAAIENAKGPDHKLIVRIDTTIAEIRASGAMKSGAVDPKLLQQVAAEQDVPELAKGGDVPKLETDLPLLERIADTIADAVRWIGEKLEKLFEWFLDLFPRREITRPGAQAGMSWIIYAVVGAIVILIVVLAISVARRSKRDETTLSTSEPLGSKRDEDPLSRGATEWERYAAQLAAAGRHREAIRAWYHAVLVTCYSAGVLHFRKGRTNWEYVAMLGPSLAWRPEMIGLTRRFEREWYGADESTREVLDDCSARARAILDAVRMRGAA